MISSRQNAECAVSLSLVVVGMVALDKTLFHNSLSSFDVEVVASVATASIFSGSAMTSRGLRYWTCLEMGLGVGVVEFDGVVGCGCVCV